MLQVANALDVYWGRFEAFVKSRHSIHCYGSFTRELHMKPIWIRTAVAIGDVLSVAQFKRPSITLFV